jgi:hypothetical protein
MEFKGPPANYFGLGENHGGSMKILNLMLSAFLLVEMGCSASATTSNGNNPNAVQAQAVCGLSNSMSGAMVVCINFFINSASNQSDCNGGAEYTRYASAGAGSSSYVTVNTPGASISCPRGSSTPSVGICSLSDRSVVYYSTSWTLSNAQGDCASRSGVWGN